MKFALTKYFMFLNIFTINYIHSRLYVEDTTFIRIIVNPEILVKHIEFLPVLCDKFLRNKLEILGIVDFYKVWGSFA